MNLIERCAHLREKIKIHDDLRRAHKEAEAFRDRASRLKEIRKTLDDSLGKLKVLQTKGVALSKIPDSTTAISYSDEYSRKLAERSPEEGRTFGRLTRSFQKIGNDLTDVVKKALDSIKRDLPTIEEPFLKQVELIPAYATQVANIRRERDGLLAWNELGRMTPGELAAFLDRGDELRRLASQLDPAEFPKAVLDFFRAARQQGGAPLEKFTETVRAWLEERDQLKNVRLTITAR